MGYDPSTHQIWVKLIGLPLQAWTVMEIQDIVQNFGHPLQILPFGEAAGHYRDITVLVAAKHPSRIPLAYIYKEGEYSTQVDILILAFRPWEDSYFHPPQDHPPQIGPHNQLQQHDNHTISVNHSSSSSNSAPSEPTIDYSYWSPRSYSLQPTRKLKWIPKSTMLKMKPSNSTPDHPPLRLNHYPSTNKQICLKISHAPIYSRPATKNPTPLHNPRWTVLDSLTLSLSLPNPIHINSHLPLSSDGSDNGTLGAAPKTPIISPLRITPPPQPKHLMALTLHEGYMSPT